MNIFRKLLHLLNKYYDALVASIKAANYYKLNYFQVLNKCFELRRQYGVLPQEAYNMGLLAPNEGTELLSQYYSISTLVRYQLLLNPRLFVFMTENKIVANKILELHDTKIPLFYAHFSRNSSGLDQNNELIYTEQDWIIFLENTIPADFIIKPTSGSYGREISIFSRKSDHFLSASGKRFSAKEIYDSMNTNSIYDSFFIQERITNHQDFNSLVNTKALQTIRFITYIDSKGKSHILLAYLKIANEQSIIDNMNYGKNGNHQAYISDKGVLGVTYTKIKGEPGMKRITHHPDSNALIEGFQIPYWDESCSLVKDVAKQFLPLRFLGWDVAVTDDGPKMIEGNYFFGAPEFPGSVKKMILFIKADNSDFC